MTTRKRLLPKVLRYHLPLAEVDSEAALASMALHWKGFTWRSGPWIVKWFSDYQPEMQVWAATKAEGRRVIRHALSHIGLTDDIGEWYYARVTSSRYGKISTVYATMASARPTSQGLNAHLPIL